MSKYNVKVSLNKKQTVFIASIHNEKDEVIKEFAEVIGSMGVKFHQKLLNRRCIDYIKNEYEEPTDFIQTTTYPTSGGFTTTEAISGASNI